MVTADVKRDYYADLGVPQSADSEEIKKQFRLLAKLYHPDRNPGRETEVVPKFQALQAAHEVLSDPLEKAKYDSARARQAREQAREQARTGNSTAQDSDPYNFRRPPPKSAANAQNYPFPPPPKNKPNAKPQFHNRQQDSTAGQKFQAFTRPQQYDRARYEDAQAETGRFFSNLRPNQPPRPSRPHPTAQRQTPKPPSPDLPHGANHVPPTFPGMSRTANARRPGFSPTTTSSDEPAAPRTSAYAYVRGDRPNSSDHYNMHQSPPLSKVRPPASPLRHTRSSDQDMRPDKTARPVFERTSSKYAANLGERTDINGVRIGRSASVRTSPVGRAFENGTSRRPQSHQESPPQRHHSASPKMKATVSPPDFSETSSEDDSVPISAREKKVPKRPGPKVVISDRDAGHRAFSKDDPALTGSFTNKNYTRVVSEETQYHYPPPLSREGPTRQPFPDLISPDEVHLPDFNGPGFRYVSKDNSQAFNNATRHPAPDPIFRAANFSSEDWAERFKNNTSPRKGSKSSKTPFQPESISHKETESNQDPNHPQVNNEPDVMDIDDDANVSSQSARTPLQHSSVNSAKMAPDVIPRRPSKNGINLEELSKQAPFSPSATGLKDMHDLASNLPWESRASEKVNLEKSTTLRLRELDLPKPPKCIVPPSLDQLNVGNWNKYVENLQTYMQDWNGFNEKMIDHFKVRQDQFCRGMADNWISMIGDGPSADELSPNDPTINRSRAGYGTYMDWLRDDAICRQWWENANEKHRQCLEDLGRIRDVVKNQQK